MRRWAVIGSNSACFNLLWIVVDLLHNKSTSTIHHQLKRVKFELLSICGCFCRQNNNCKSRGEMLKLPTVSWLIRKSKSVNERRPRLPIPTFCVMKIGQCCQPTKIIRQNQPIYNCRSSVIGLNYGWVKWKSITQNQNILLHQFSTNLWEIGANFISLITRKNTRWFHADACHLFSRSRS